MLRAVLSGARIMLLDEPFWNTDFVMRRDLQQELSHRVYENRSIAILVTHDIDEAVRMGDKIIILTARPAHVKAEIEIPTPRDLQLKGGADVMREMSTYVERVETLFAHECQSPHKAQIKEK